MTNKYKSPSLWLSLLPVATLVCLLAIAIYLFQGDALGGASQIVLLLATALCAAIAYFCYGIRWAVIEAQIAKNIFGIAPSVLILLLIGTLSGSWMISGVVPSLIYYGLQVMQTDFFLVACCLLCSIVSVMTSNPVGLSCAPKPWISNTTTRLSRLTLLCLPKISKEPVV